MARIVTVTLNPTIDVSTTVDRLAPEHKLRCSPERRDPGGGGINVARVVRRLGGDVLALYPAGGPIGYFLEGLVLHEGVQTLEVPMKGVTRESFTVIERASGKEFRFVLPGPELSEAEFELVINALEGLAPHPSFIVCSGSLPRGAPDDAYARIAALAKRRGSKLVLDASGKALVSALKTGVHLVKPSRRELEELVGTKLESVPALVSAARGLIESGQAEIVVVTMGSQGALLATAQHAWISEAIAVPVISSVGAGDSFLGAMMWAMERSHDLVDAFRHGMAAGAASLMVPGTQLCAAEDVRRLVSQVRERSV